MIRLSGTQTQNNMKNRPRLSRPVRALSWLPAVFLVVGAVAQSPIGVTAPPSIAVDRGAIERLYGPNKNDTRGALRDIGSYVQGAQLVREGFALTNVVDGGAFVEVVSFPKGYRYAMHDLFGSLLKTAAYDEKLSGSGDLAAAVDKVQCVEWEFENGNKSGVVCYAGVEGGKIAEGVVAWLKGNADDGVVTIRIAYRHPKGHLPGQVIDKYLREYPSSVPENPTWHVDWETKDLEKWADVLRANSGDPQILQAGTAYLLRYDKRSFGLLDAMKKRDDGVAYSQALDEVASRLSKAAEERRSAAQKAKEGG